MCSARSSTISGWTRRIGSPEECRGWRKHPRTLAKETVPITGMLVRSIFVRPEPAERVPAGAVFEVEGIAFDGGTGIKQVDLSLDGGQTWVSTELGDDLGKYSFRRWRYRWTPAAGQYAAEGSRHEQLRPAERQWRRTELESQRLRARNPDRDAGCDGGIARASLEESA